MQLTYLLLIINKGRLVIIKLIYITFNQILKMF